MKQICDFTENEQQEIEYYYVTHSLTETIEKYDIDYNTFDQIINNVNIFGIKHKPRYKNLTYQFKQDIAEYYKDHSSHDARSRFHVALDVIYKVRDEFELPKRTRSEELYMSKITKYGTIENYNEIAKQASQKTSLERYGVTNFAKSEQFRKKSKNTCLIKYGVENVMQSDSIKQHLSNVVKEKYGVQWACMRKEARMHGNDSKPNQLFAETLQENNILYSREFPILNYSYDFLICQRNILVEVDPTSTHNSTYGLYNTNPLDKNYHKKKSQTAIEGGYSCIHIWDWDDQNKIIQLIKQRDRIFARKCKICEVSIQESVDFINKYHLQNYVKDQIRIGLYYQNQLVSIMTFGKPRYNKNYQYELLRYCSSMNIVGGAEKLFAYFIKRYNPESIISYCDKSKFTGNVYKKLGFNSLGDPNPSKHWYNMKTGRHITDNLLRQRGFDQLFGTNYGKGTSNEQLMLEHGFVEIYDCGQETFIWRITK